VGTCHADRRALWKIGKSFDGGNSLSRHPQISRIKGAFTAFEPKWRALIRKSVFGVRVDMGTAAAAEAYTLVNTAVPA